MGGFDGFPIRPFTLFTILEFFLKYCLNYLDENVDTGRGFGYLEDM